MHAADVTDPEAVAALADAVPGPLDVLVHNAGGNAPTSGDSLAALADDFRCTDYRLNVSRRSSSPSPSSRDLPRPRWADRRGVLGGRAPRRRLLRCRQGCAQRLGHRPGGPARPRRHHRQRGRARLHPGDRLLGRPTDRRPRTSRAGWRASRWAAPGPPTRTLRLPGRPHSPRPKAGFTTGQVIGIDGGTRARPPVTRVRPGFQGRMDARTRAEHWPLCRCSTVSRNLASLRQYAAEARGRAGRLVLVSGEAGVGKSSLVEAVPGRASSATPPGSGAHATGWSHHGPSHPLRHIARAVGGEPPRGCPRRPAARRGVRRRPALARTGRRPGRPRRRGRAVGRRRDARPAPVPRPPAPRPAGPARGHLPRRRARARRHPPGGAGRADRPALDTSHRPPAPLPRRSLRRVLAARARRTSL